MITKELSETAVELNIIFENCSAEVLEKIPNKFKDFLKRIESKTYKFNYDSNKTLNEQKIKPKTRRMLALIYKDYLCSEEQKKEYLKLLNNFFKKDYRLKSEKYSPDNLFKKTKKNLPQKTNNELVEIKEKDSIIIKIIKFIKKIIRR